ncbi:hypothetical protein BDQ12DRAFT_677387 [Crucibulum laeve]|uniref:Uncharacterized protein n=1 Tax=Crucibulum laeve TaxID=68775 RepID=A0A5C3MBV1_9AGAR|nr:hypothetical protein BDQ12DRAFT_677387 [Crucibulum laeve]
MVVTTPSAYASAPNPYINPPPSLDEIRRVEEERKTTNISRNLAMTSDVTRMPEDEEMHGNWRLADSEKTSPVETTRPHDDPAAITTLPRASVDGRKTRNDDGKQPSNVSQQSQSKFPNLPRVDKLLSISKLFSDGTQKTESNTTLPGTVTKSTSPAADRSSVSPTLPSRERPQSRGKLVKRKSSNGPGVNTTSSTEEMRQLPVLDIRRAAATASSELDVVRRGGASQPTTSIEHASGTWQRRPLLSHGPSSSGSSWSSLDTNSDATQGPASTEDHEHRISISSTVYPSSSAHSHSLSMYSTHDSHPRSQYPPADRTSFIDLFSPERPEFTAADTAPPPKHAPRDHSHSPKPPVPTTPKPVFNRPPRKSSRSRHSSPKDTSPGQTYNDYRPSPEPLPPTTNFLDLDERADLIRKTRKLARMFGQSPGADAMAQQECTRPLTSTAGPDSVRLKHQRGALSISNDLDKPTLRHRLFSGLPSPDEVQFANIAARRHSLPLSPDDYSFLGDLTPTRESNLSQLAIDPNGRSGKEGSRTSFIDLSDEEIMDDGAASVLITPKPKKIGVPRPSSPSAQSLFENMTPEEQAEEERRRKRDKLAKLHRFLGSQVPANLVLGLDDPEGSLPPEVPVIIMPDIETGAATRKAWLRRRRSSSAAAFPSSWSDDIDRIKEDLNDEEKAINVRRAQKMEKVFGIAPPQTLYHTRHSPSPSLGNKATHGPSADAGSSRDISPTSIQRNPNRSAYAKPKSKKNERPGTSESSKALLPKRRDSSLHATHVDGSNQRNSVIYTHYQHSLNSLNDILDRDDRESLAELHQYLSSGEVSSPPLQEFKRASERRISNASIKSERRRSLPARTSLISIASEYTITTPKPEITDFQLRRRRAAKLTQFFGVGYRELINDVLESIENGLEHERKHGTLRAEEVEDLLDRLRNLRIKRQGIA